MPSIPFSHFRLPNPNPNPVTPTVNIISGGSGPMLEKQLPLEANPARCCNWAPSFRDGLPTPPGDMAGVAYNNASSANNYGPKSNGIPFYHPYVSSRMHNSQYPSRSHSHPDPAPSVMVPAYKSQNLLPSSSVGDATSVVPSKNFTNKPTPSLLEIPSTISANKGNLAEFAAQMTCLFWFEKTAKLRAIEDRLHPTPCLLSETFPTVGFQKWVTTVLSTTQVSQNVILLALLFIYRMKKFNPGVKGKKGSECRLLTVALMLGNKFLDDNTYTNKTWAEVSGISVHEIHIMEVEFLSNIRYNLFVSKDEWQMWHAKLGLFANYFNESSLFPVEDETSPSTTTTTTTTATAPALHFSPSQTPTPRLQPPSPLSRLPSPPLSNSLRQQQNWNQPLSRSSYLAAPHNSRGDAPTSANSRKRGRDEQVEEHPTKRIAMSNPVPSTASAVPPSSILPPLPPVLTPSTAPAPSSHMPTIGSVARLPFPSFPPSSNGPVQNALPAVSQLPTPNSRPIPSSIYNPSPNWIQQIPTSTPAPPSVAPGLYTAPTTTLLEPANHQPSPYAVPSAAVSPVGSTTYSAHTPVQMHLSPSFVLANRNSPYRPVRAVNTLLIPPPSTSLRPLRNIPFDHMHYQPLGKTAAESKTGLLPYLHHGAWPQGPFGQPNFNNNQGFSG